MEILLKKMKVITSSAVRLALALLVASTTSFAMFPAAALAENTTGKASNTSTPASPEENESQSILTSTSNVSATSISANNTAASRASEHSLSVLDANGNAPDFANGAWNLTNGTYIVSGISQSFEGLKITGSITLNLNDAIIDHTFPDPNYSTSADTIDQFAPAISIESGNVQMNLNGKNTAKGAPGYAGVYVAEGASLTIAGNGSLNAVGGNSCNNEVPLPDKFPTPYGCFGGGAGIGGNGIWVETNQYGNNHKEMAGYYPNFGTIQIDNGTINAAGGNYLNAGNLAAGAGIGTGGCSGGSIGQTYPIGFPVKGSIRINNGTITATGGNAYKNPFGTGGGAGIGSGGVTGHHYEKYSNDVSILINGGTIVATGKSDGAGIGGGTNMNAGPITITNGQIIAKGGDEENGEPWGGAGIGGGEESYASVITISGGTIEATGGGAAAGIGSGNMRNGLTQLKGRIFITGTTNIMAYSGSVDNYPSYPSSGITANEISLSGQVNISAYSSGNARGIVAGSGGLTVSNITSLWVQTEKKDEPAIPSLSSISYSSPHTYLTTSWSYQNSSISPDIAYGWLDLPSNNFAGDKQFKYEWDENGLKIDGNLIPPSSGFSPPGGSWAALYSEPYEVNVSYEYVSGNYPDAVTATLPSPTTTMSNVGFNAQTPSEVDGWTFNGWFTEADCDVAFINGTKLTTNTILYGEWNPETDPSQPDNMIVPPVDTIPPATGEADSFDQFGYMDPSELNGSGGDDPQTQAAPKREIKRPIRLAQTGDNTFYCLAGIAIAILGGTLIVAIAAWTAYHNQRRLLTEKPQNHRPRFV